MDQSIISKPTILLYATEHISEDVLKPVLYGIEEEGLPVVIESHSGYSQYPDSLRTLGVNAARLVKGNPFVSDERLEVAF